MSFIEEHAGALPRASALAAIGEAFGFLKEGGIYTVQMILLCGVFTALMGVFQGLTSAKGAWLGVTQAIGESFFIYNWHRYALLGERYFGQEHWMAFFKRTLFYYFVLAVMVIAGTLVFLSAIDGLSDTATVAFFVVGTIVLYLLIPRIGLVFPAIAINSSASKMRHAFILSSGNTLALAGAYFLMSLVFVALLAPSYTIWHFTEPESAQAAASIPYVVGINALIGFPIAVTTFLWAGLNSSLFKQLGGMDNLENSEPTERADGDQA